MGSLPHECHTCHISISSPTLTRLSTPLSHHPHLLVMQPTSHAPQDRGKNDGITLGSRVPSLVLIGPAHQRRANAPLHLSLYYIPTWQTVPFANQSTALSGMVQSPPNFRCSFYTFWTSFPTISHFPTVTCSNVRTVLKKGLIQQLGPFPNRKQQSQLQLVPPYHTHTHGLSAP